MPIQPLENADFLHQAFLGLHLCNPLPLAELDSCQFLGELVHTNIHLSKGPLSKEPTYSVELKGVHMRLVFWR